jgi:hypothetical protein
MSGIAGFGEVLFCDEHGVVVADRPQAVVEEPVGVLGEGDAVVQGVVAAAGELVDVGGVECWRRVPINAYLLSLTPVGSSITGCSARTRQRPQSPSRLR